jgi:hypothetical protein
MNKLIASLFAAAIVASTAAPAIASAFTAGQVINIARWDRLKVRKWPASYSQVIDQYRRGELVSLTGRCKNIKTNASFRIDTGGSSGRRFAKMEMPNVWCQVMTEDAELGWVRGKYVYPQ